jgi:SNF2 family DNA or RNA helicase
MGLGKTLQALAIILEKAPEGPSLVVAPTSVCMNWLQEANRFAPTLRMHMLGSRNRKKLVKSLKEFDVLVTSYTLLQQEAEMFAGIDWHIIVLDEAQAIKNMETKRSRAAMSLNGRFKLLTTGTPIENHLGELWNLFNFILPGLLGSLESFNRRFAVPIERFGDQLAKQKLKKLIRPFILRRTKTQVLEELPPRTEITLQVEMNSKELAFYPPGRARPEE